MNKAAASSFALTVAALVAAGCGKGGATEGAESADGAESAERADDSAATKVKCMGINECKGQGACDTVAHSCAQQNECKGKGWVLATEAECQEKGGEVI